MTALFFGSGAFWPILQLTAWATMDEGQASCELCLTVEKGVTARRLDAAPAVDFAPPHSLVVPFDVPSEPVSAVVRAAAPRDARPDSPPPKALPA